MAVSILLSFTYGLSGANAIVVLMAVFLGGIYGGSRSAILLNVPGTPSSAATALDGFPLARKGEGGIAGIVVTTFSSLGGLLGLVILAVATPLIARFALKFGYWEYFWLAMMGVLISASITTGDSLLYKGVISGFLGMLISCVGMDPIHGYSRMCYGSINLMAGINLVPAMIGLFGMAEVYNSIKDPESHEVMESGKKASLFTLMGQSFKFLAKYPRLFLQSSLIGTFIGALPGVGPDIASWVAYGTAKRGSKHPEEFGKGSYEGVIASETANNAATSGVFIPLLTLGIPGDAVSAVILGGIQMHGYRPGPTFFFESPSFVYFIAGVLLLVNIVMWFQGCYLTSIIAKVLKVPMEYIMSLVVILCVVGSYTINMRKFDVLIMLIVGFKGMGMRKLKIPPAPMALGIILGSMGDLNFRRGMIAGGFSILSFFTRPLSMILISLLVISLGYPAAKKLQEKVRSSVK
jgi:putative tricarboxylic transport membrane protein